MRSIKQLLVALVVTTLAACGGGGTLNNDGGGTGGGTGGGATPVFSLDVTLSNAAGDASTALAQATPLTVTATLTATNNGVVSGRLIEFTLSNTALATFGNTAGTAITNADGVATITLLAGSSSGAGVVTASFNDTSAEAAFESAGDGGDQVDVTVGSVALIADNLQLGTGVSDQVELTALVRDANNVVISGVPVVFSTDSGELAPLDDATAENGTARATLTTQTDKSNRTMLVTARVQQQVAQLTITVVGNQLEISAPESIVLGDTVNVDVFLTDSNGSGIQGTEVQVASALDNTLSDDSPATSGTSGKASFTYTATNSGNDVLTVTAAGITALANINVSADAFAFLTMTDASDEALPGDPVQEVALNTAQQIEVEWLVNDAANPAAMVNFATTRGVIADAAANLANDVSTSNETDAQGVAEAYIRSEYAGLVTLSATGGTGDNAVSAKKVIEFVATEPAVIETQAIPAQVGPGESSTVRAVVRDANNNPVKNQAVVFSLDNAAGGAISSGVAITNSQGVATTEFTADATTGAGVNGLNLQVKAALQNDNSISNSADIAVGKRTLFFRFGTGNEIEEPTASTYRKEFSIVVTDSSGNPVAGQNLNVTVVPVSYGKGQWVRTPPAPAAFEYYDPVRSITCPNEDIDLDGILDPLIEDTNGDGQLTPGNVVAVSAAEPGQPIIADDSGIATFYLTYTQDYGAWVDIVIQVSGSAAGTENVSSRAYTLDVSSDDVTNEDVPPPPMPYGQIANCASVD
ncbi:Ig-like domain-containing protein [Rheinheimera fenheensis]|uniref:Ig-like domain-containing protein n=1 Tax=Rheinheimera fenheensis TaxID=3152295 RepID=UPI00325D44C5